jgi:superfamily II DNA or RNA helicase
MYTPNPEMLCSTPIECVPLIAKFGAQEGYLVDDNITPQFYSGPRPQEKRAHNFQIEGARKILENKRFMLNFEMGLGKTFTTILAMKTAQAKSALIICPAIVRTQWVDEIKKWWPDAPKASVLSKGSAPQDTPILITSYELASKVKDMAREFVVVDECHYISNTKATRSAVVRRILEQNENSYCVGLTATPITNEPSNLYNQIDTFWKGRVGTFWNFAYHYCNVDSTEYTDFWVHGVNEVYSNELKTRLEAMTLRVTKHAVEHLLPPFIVTPIRVESTRKFAEQSLKDFTRMDKHNINNDTLIRACGMQKLGAVEEFTKNTLDSGNRHLVILTHLKQTTRDIEKVLQKNKIATFRFDGDDSVVKREALIQTALKCTEPCALICTMHSVKEGINTMAQFDHALLAELYYTPGVMTQVLGRFHRLSGACNVSVLYVQGSHEELIAAHLQQKLDAVKKVQNAGVAEGALSGAFNKLSDEDDAQIFIKLQKVALERIEEDVY